MNLRDEVARGLRGDPPGRPVPPALTAVIARLALDPAARFADLPARLAALAPPPRPRPAQRSSRRRR